MHLYVWCHVILKWIGHKTSAHTDIQYIIILQVLAKYCLYTFCMHILYICFMYWYISCYKCTVAPSSMICPTTPHLRKISFLAKLHLSPTSESLPLFFFNFPYPLHWFAPQHIEIFSIWWPWLISDLWFVILKQLTVIGQSIQVTTAFQPYWHGRYRNRICAFTDNVGQEIEQWQTDFIFIF